MIRRVFSNLYFLTFLNGFLLATLFYFKTEADYEKELFHAIHMDMVAKIAKGISEDSEVVKVMHACHDLMSSRTSVFGATQFMGFKSQVLEPTSFDLMTANGACGSFSMVLARMLQGFKYDVRIAQLKCVSGVYAEHNIVEVKTAHGWVVLDPLFNIYFINPAHQLAGFSDVRNNWTYYKNQLPADYDMHYRYEDVRYSNWTKIPVILPAVKKILDLTIGKTEADTISIRTYLLRKYKIGFNLFLIIFILVFSFTLIKLIRAKIFPQKDIPLTFTNIYKYLRLRFASKDTFTEHGQA
jgi:hypothetical protein